METANERSEVILQEDLEKATVSSSSSEEQQEEETGLEEASTKADKNTKSTAADKEKKKNKHKAVFNVIEAHYPVVRYVGKKLMNYKLTKDVNADWDLYWVDNAVLPETLAKMKPYQKINHFPGMYSLARKNHLGRNLMRMKKAFPKNFKFFPQTYLLPAEYSEFKQQCMSKKGYTFIVKPEASCQGKGIFLTKKWEDLEPGEHYVVQRYLSKPLLLEGLKFDLRIYVLLAGCDPLRIYLFDDGLGRFATEEYVAPTANNMENMCMHLTNYAINKDNPNFVFNESSAHDDVGHKRSLKATMKQLENEGYDVKTLWNEIKKIIIKTFCSVQPILAHSYKSCQPDEPYNNMCFEVLGFDILLDHKLKPLLLEVNHTPSFTTDTPLDKTIKRNVIKDALTLMNISANHRIKYKNKKKAEMQERVLTGKKTKLTVEEKEAAKIKAQKERDAWESKHLGGYEKIYPIDNPEEDYEGFISAAQTWWENWTGTASASKKSAKKAAPAENTKPLPTAPGSTGLNLKMKEQRSASEKLKLNPTSRKISSSKKPERNDGLFELGKKNDESLTDAIVDHETQPRTEITPSSSCKEGEQVTVETEDLNFVSKCKGAKGDEIGIIDEKNGLLTERSSKANNPEGPISVIDFTQNRVCQSENTLRAEENSQRELITDHFKSPPAIRKPYISLTTKESSYKPRLSPVEPDNSKTSLRERPQTFTNQQKFPPISMKVSTLTKLVDNADEESPLTKRNNLQKLPIKSVTRVSDEAVSTDDFLQDRKSRNSSHIENAKSLIINKNGLIKNSAKKMEPQTNQSKLPIGSYVVPRMFELSVKKETTILQPTRQPILHLGANSVSRGLIKGSQIRKDPNNLSNGLSYTQDSQVNSQKGTFYYHSKK